jgi:hypothetical protein
MLSSLNVKTEEMKSMAEKIMLNLNLGMLTLCAIKWNATSMLLNP